MKRLALIAAAYLIAASACATASKHPATERSIAVRGFKGKISVVRIDSERVEIRTRTWRVNRDTVTASGLFPLWVNGHRESFYCGRFGASRLPMLVIAISDPREPERSRCLAFQLTPNGTLIGQQVVADQSTMHPHTEQATSGRYELTAVNTQLGAIYMIAYQDANFEGYFVSYEKLRVRQWDPTINAFIEADQGFLRDHSGRLVQSSRYRAWPASRREQLFAANVRSLPSWRREVVEGRSTPVVAARGR